MLFVHHLGYVKVLGRALGVICYHILKFNAHKTNQFVSSGFRKKVHLVDRVHLVVPAPVIMFDKPMFNTNNLVY